MENEPPNGFVAHSDARSSKKGRFMGKLFGRDRKTSATDEEPPSSPADLNAFFRGSTDRLDVTHPAPPPPRLPLLAKLDISKATRYPDAHSVNSSQQALPLRPRSRSPEIRRNKGLVVRFVDTFPEIIGDGGDECEIPTLEISKRKPVRPRAVTAATAPARPADVIGNPQRAFPDAQKEDDFVPTPLRRTQTGYSTISDASERAIPAGKSIPSRFLDSQVTAHDERRRSFIEIHQAEMREAEGLAFATAHRDSAATSPQPRAERQHTPPPKAAVQNTPSRDDQTDQTEFTASPEQHNPPQLPVQTAQVFKPYQPPQPSLPSSTMEASPNQRILQGPFVEQSPSSIYSSSSGFATRQPSTRQGSKLSDTADQVSSSQKSSLHLGDGAPTPGDEALDIFVARTRHLFALFRLHSEMVKPLVAYSLAELARAALWWFLRGRMALEMSIRERSSTPQDQQRNEFAREQAYADLAKGYWLSQDVIPDIAESRRLPIEADVDEARKALKSNLQKLTLSMQRNGFLPPEEAFLPQTIDKSIWVEYPGLTQDIVSLLWGSPSSALVQAHNGGSGMSILETLPLGDSAYYFCFNRVPADVFLMEQGAHESSRLYFPCLLSVVRPQKQGDLIFVIASQNGAVQFRIQGDRSAGPVWDDVRWRSDACCIDVRLPRGFILVVQCAQPDYKMLWNMYDFSAKVQSSLYPRKDEQCVFRSTLKTFQYFDNDPQSRQFPKEPTPNCDIALFENVMREGAATGPRSHHRGFRIAVVTGTKTKTLSGVNQVYLPQQPVQYGFLRGEQNDPALSLKFENGRQKGSMVMTFGDEKERLRLHSLLVGTALRNGEQVYCELPIRGLWFAKYFGDVQSFQAFSALPWERVRVINEDGGGDRPSCVLADKLRIVFECKEGTITDRVNVAPGELKLRLDVANPNCLMVYRNPQPDFTVAITEAKVPRELTLNLTRDLEALQQVPTLRTYMFPTVAELHQFQEALTGFTVVFDGIASTFAIARRRMVVPIHKKWEAGATRIQVVQQDKVVQLLAFFDDFSHGKCMSFTLKGTDVFESFGKGSKSGVKFDDAKFPLPRVVAGENTIQETADTAFVCLDLPELPGEHDDISITFENEADRDRLVQCLPAPVKSSRLGLKK
ncbi:hypothetical protein BR93DRAFT_768976 [Coniochaeta sp. PMI_546]|nr:hypothetical protein BR93DRAFT_768976 [Coniochaeta sp. PMI_546]